LTKRVVNPAKGGVDLPSLISLWYTNAQFTITYNLNSKKKYIDFPQKEQIKNRVGVRFIEPE
jgi:hypothetical protein